MEKIIVFHIIFENKNILQLNNGKISPERRKMREIYKINKNYIRTDKIL